MWLTEGDLPGAVVDPVSYVQTWVYLALALVALSLICAVGWWLVRRWTGRPAEPAPEPAAPPPPPPPPKLDPSAALRQIDQVFQSYRAGQLPARQAHHQLSAIVRACATDQLQLPAKQLTLQGLENLRAPQLGQVTLLVRFLYPAQFGLEPAATVDQAVARARAVVMEWN